jgi:DMSO/TMAO reductase YedYZ molybdopterin-dependent catalytic subunit
MTTDRALIARDKPRLRPLDDPAVNAEADPTDLDAATTPVQHFFVRNNGDLPSTDTAAADDWRLEITGEIDRPRSFTLGELKQRFEIVSETAVLECAGNGRAFFVPAVSGAQWTLGAIGCARWTGIRMADLIREVGLRASAVHTAHHSPDRMIGKPDRPALSRGIPIEKALAPETLLAFAMNDAPLHALHGAPLRVVVPGYPGSAWQKWLSQLDIRDREHDGEKMTGTDYRLPLDPVGPGDPIDPTRFAVITDIPVKSLITSPAEGFRCSAGAALEVRGFAWSGATPVARVEVSADDGATWLPAALEEAGHRFAWRRFRTRVQPMPGPLRLVARARDAAGRLQPVGGARWNPRGYANNGAHRVAGIAVHADVTPPI